MDTVESLDADLIVVTQQISYIYANLHMQRLEIETPHGKTVVWHSDFRKMLNILEERKLNLQNKKALLEGTQSQSVINWDMPARAVPIVFKGN